MNIERHWYRKTTTLTCFLLLPFSWLFRLVVAIRFYVYRFHLKKSYRFPVPVIVVGNVTVGGTGKTPMVIWLVNFLRQQGFKPGVVSRGVGGKNTTALYDVNVVSDPSMVGDEAVLIVRRAKCPMMISKNRVVATKALLEKYHCDVVISDDGLQHYRLGRDVEIVMVDGDRQFGNGHLLPAGPLRERLSRLQRAEFMVVQGEGGFSVPHPALFNMQLQGDMLSSLTDSSVTKSLNDFSGQRVHAVAGVGNPDRFFAALRARHIDVIPHVFTDHYLYQAGDIDFGDELPVIMTEKDAVKCFRFAKQQHWFLPVDAMLEKNLGERILQSLKRCAS